MQNIEPVHMAAEFTPEMRATAEQMYSELKSKYPARFWLIIHDMFARHNVEASAEGFAQTETDMSPEDCLYNALDPDILCGEEAEKMYVSNVREAAERRYGRQSFEDALFYAMAPPSARH